MVNALGPVRKIHIHTCHCNGIDHLCRTGDIYFFIIQFPVFLIHHIVFLLVTVVQYHRNRLSHQVVYLNGDSAGILLQNGNGVVRHIAGVCHRERNFVDTCFINTGHVQKDRNIGLVQLIQIGSVAFQVQGNRGLPLVHHRKAAAFQGTHIALVDRDIVVMLIGVGTDYRNHVQPQTNGNTQGKQAC